MTNRNRIHIADWELEREQPYAYWLMCAPIGDATKSRLLLRFGRPSGVFEASEKALLDSTLSIGKKERWIAYIKERKEEKEEKGAVPEEYRKAYGPAGICGCLLFQ